MTDPTPFNTADRLAPIPEDREAPAADWIRYFAGQALAAHAVFRASLGKGAGVELGYLMVAAVSSTAAAAALISPDDIPGRVWDLTPELGSLNGEEIDWLAGVLAGMGVNPAHIFRWYDAADFEVNR